MSTITGMGRSETLQGNQNARSHGMARSPEYQSWNHMRIRCTDPTCDSYARYGGRGITVCERWANSFSEFVADVGRRPGDGYCIERIDNDGNYEPGNVRWATATEQARNRSNNRPVEYEGVTRPLSVWAEECGIARHTLRMRIERGWSVRDALTVPVQRRTRRGVA